MIFLLQYNRPQGRLVTFRKFPAAERSVAERERLELELELNRRKIDHEVVILEADDEAALRLTHGRCFPDGLKLLQPDVPRPN